MNYKAFIDVIWKSIKNSFSGIIWKWLLSSSSALFGLLLFGKNFFNNSVSSSIKLGISVLIFLFITRFVLFLVRNSFKYLHNLYRESKYGDAIVYLKDAFAKAHALRKKVEKSDEEFIRTMIYLCDSVQKVFNGKNLCKCSVSIKVPVRGELTEQTSVINLCRDSEHSAIRDDANYKAINHTIIGNTAFRKVLNNVLRNKSVGFHYLNNDISKSEDYDNTSKEAYHEGKLPYNSEIVVPIIPVERDRLNTYETLGFLCVDCVSRNKFDAKYDVPLLEGVADGIYDILSLYKANFS